MNEKKVIVVDDTPQIAHEVANVASRGLTASALAASIAGLINYPIRPISVIRGGTGWLDSEPRRRNFTEPYHGPSKAKRRARKAQRQARRRNRQ